MDGAIDNMPWIVLLMIVIGGLFLYGFQDGLSKNREDRRMLVLLLGVVLTLLSMPALLLLETMGVYKIPSLLRESAVPFCVFILLWEVCWFLYFYIKDRLTSEHSIKKIGE